MTVLGKMFSIAGINAHYRSILYSRNVLSNVQSYTTYKVRDLEKLGVPPRPQRPLTPYFKFIKDHRMTVATENPGKKPQDIIKILAQKWTNYNPAEKDALQKMYESELITYSKRVISYEQSMTPEQKNALRDAKEQIQARREKLQFKKKNKSLGKPKKPPTAFFQFLQDQKFLKAPNQRGHDWVKMMADTWRNMSFEKKEKYRIECQRLMEQYKQDLGAWEEKMVGLGHLDVVRNRGLIDLKLPKAE